MRQRTFRVLFALALAIACDSRAPAALLFSNYTDTIQVAGNTILTTQATIEATIVFSSLTYPAFGGGRIYNEWVEAAEDVGLVINNGGSLFGVAYPNNITGGAVATQTYYDIAYVYSGTQQLLYINGNLAASAAGSGAIGSGQNDVAAVGALFRDSTTVSSFLGEIESLRISNTARYSGSSYTPTFGDFSDDASTELLYDFDTAPLLGYIIPDLSGNRHTGTLGVGFTGATSPTFVTFPEPASLAVMGLFAEGCLMRRRREVR